jgi:hypothetical protein
MAVGGYVDIVREFLAIRRMVIPESTSSWDPRGFARASLAVILLTPSPAGAQQTAVTWLSWTALQMVPSPVFMDDRGPSGARALPALQWHLTPVNYSFAANPLVGPVSVLMVNPVRRYGGSVELFLQPEWALDAFRHAGVGRFQVTVGARGYIPADEYGEYLSLSFGSSILLRQTAAGSPRNAAAVEAGLHTLFGILGLQVRYQFVSDSRYTVGLVLRYY